MFTKEACSHVYHGNAILQKRQPCFHNCFPLPLETNCIKFVQNEFLNLKFEQRVTRWMATISGIPSMIMGDGDEEEQDIVFLCVFD